MALDPFGYGCEELIYSMGGGSGTCWGYDLGLQEAILETNDSSMSMIEQLASHGFHENWDTSSPSPVKEWDLNSSPETCTVKPLPAGARRKRRHNRSTKNKEELENQRMTHIAVERNRRKQMNEYLSVLRSLMPSSYVQRGDQASIVGGAINFVKELEQQMQAMEAQKRGSPFSEFFSFPQYSTRATQCNSSPTSSSSASSTVVNGGSAAAEIEVTLVETHALLKILSKKQPRQLLKMVAGFQSLRLTVLHLNVTTTLDHMVLYSISVKVEEGSQMNTVDEIAAAVNEMLWRTREEA